MIELRPLGIEDYAERHSKPLSDIHSKLWLETFNKTRSPGMMVGALEGAFLKMLVRMTGARRILEIGMFTGYSTLAWAEALPKGGHIVSCDINPETTEIARHQSELFFRPAFQVADNHAGGHVLDPVQKQQPLAVR